MEVVRLASASLVNLSPGRMWQRWRAKHLQIHDLRECIGGEPSVHWKVENMCRLWKMQRVAKKPTGKRLRSVGWIAELGPTERIVVGAM
ncbi:hypothetical protein EAH_00066130 [Eimeria acervulina]|uniref:Uncharacterized protein n=1 Tax=Eimeria acervulina TaxID=5801 RepID=U6GSV8_EIMAC|nr:hypothetical protein EAH_00066130 [Eimeria acervulina]CDI82363.1 hypothetical protein EAH_00066130 [Eimeria acervulina]